MTRKTIKLQFKDVKFKRLGLPSELDARVYVEHIRANAKRSEEEKLGKEDELIALIIEGIEYRAKQKSVNGKSWLIQKTMGQ